ncbi:MAG TPA: hypothetical protein EYP56_20090 [Planctomycetaceae bacterium]|nr:hypothetical protein [Planctomycetaceae bacterium]
MTGSPHDPHLSSCQTQSPVAGPAGQKQKTAPYRRRPPRLPSSDHVAPKGYSDWAPAHKQPFAVPAAAGLGRLGGRGAWHRSALHPRGAVFAFRAASDYHSLLGTRVSPGNDKMRTMPVDRWWSAGSGAALEELEPSNVVPGGPVWRRMGAAGALAALGAAILLGIAAPRAAWAQRGWTRFRGPDGTGISWDESIPVTFDERAYRWQLPLPGSGHSSPAIWGEKLFVTCENRSQQQRSVVCIDTRAGRLLWEWKTTFEPYRSHSFNSYAAATPAVDARGVYVSWVSGNSVEVVGLDHAGRRLWTRRMEDFRSRFGAGASPIVLDGVVVVANDHGGQASFLAGLDAATGHLRWKVPRKSGLVSFITPAVFRSPSGAVELVFVSPSHGITGVEPATGAVLWEVSGLFTQKTVASPVIAGQRVFATSGRGGRGVESALVRRGDAATGQKAGRLGQIDTDLPYVPTPVACDGYLFIWTDHGVVSCAEVATGKVLWRERVGGQYFASPVCVAGKLYGVSKKGEVVVLDAGPEFKLLGRSQLPEGSYATPAVADGCIYFRTFEHVLCVAGKKG